MMLTAYVDESGVGQEERMFIAGFVGSDDSRRKAAAEWKLAIAPRPSLYMKDLRLKERHRDLLTKAGAVPDRCGLEPLLGGARISDYADLIEGTDEEKILSAFVVCLYAMVINLIEGIPAEERMEIVFEEQAIYGLNAHIALAALNSLASAELCFPDGTSKLANWRSFPKVLRL